MAKHRRRRRAFTKREAKAIQRIAAKPIETKKFIANLSFGEYVAASSTLGGATVPAQAGAFYNNPLGSLPRLVRLSSAADPGQPDAAVEGDEILVRGLKIEGYALVTGTRNWTLRLSLLSGPPYGTGETWPVFPLPTYAASPFRVESASSMYEENTLFGDPTQQPFNNDKFTVLRTKTYKLGYMDGSDVRKFRMYYRMNAKKRAEVQADDADMSRKRLGFMKGKQYYWVFEWFNVVQGSALTATDNLQVRIQTSTYWKDA